MINLRMTDSREDLRAWTGLPADNHDEALWEYEYELIPKAWWLRQVHNHCVGYNEAYCNGEWYYTVHHA